jgi:hypothetical protein
MPIACGDREKGAAACTAAPWAPADPTRALRQLQAWPLHRRGDCLPQVAERQIREVGALIRRLSELSAAQDTAVRALELRH